MSRTAEVRDLMRQAIRATGVALQNAEMGNTKAQFRLENEAMALKRDLTAALDELDADIAALVAENEELAEHLMTANRLVDRLKNGTP